MRHTQEIAYLKKKRAQMLAMPDDARSDEWFRAISTINIKIDARQRKAPTQAMGPTWSGTMNGTPLQP